MLLLPVTPKLTFVMQKSGTRIQSLRKSPRRRRRKIARLTNINEPWLRRLNMETSNSTNELHLDVLESDMRARNLMTPDPYCVTARTPVSQIMRAMLDKNISAVMVMGDDGKLVGLVSEGDLVRRQDSTHQKKMDHWLALLAEGEALNLEFLHSLQLGEQTAASVMSSPVITVEEDTELAQIADLILKRGIKRVPVTRGGKLVGVVSRRDILRALLDQEN